ncbi:hypothetical protein AC790_08910 [Pantoea sp. RIT-PI-b]|uniref:hypothetical protein n=1 Tax=Pantoea sp. RIT-PI-b TaxID=1681195 RepID=UPI0006762E35|nr:hypothetical protein [Pantoea sp. RIT-PI-b]KNC14306.1 hypothetical protein AC790_08910 [Pantoea sp. RIT-PI-b]
MNLITIKNHISDSLFSLGFQVRKATTINQDAAEYILILTNLLEQNENIPMGVQNYSTLTMNVICTSKDESKVQGVMTAVYDHVRTSDFLKSFVTEKQINVSTITVSSIAEDTDTTSGINTLMLTIQMNYISR